MARWITYYELVAKQNEMMKLASELTEAEDAEKVEALSNQLKEQGEELQGMAEAFEQQNTAWLPPAAKGTTRVQLTLEQRQRVFQNTGIDLEILVLEDEAGIWARTMPHTPPQVIEKRAVEEAQRQQAAAIVAVETKQAIQQMLAVIEQSGGPELLAKLEELKQDPKFLAALYPTKK